MTKIKTSELQGAALDWAVARACNYEFNDHWFKPSTNWNQGGPLILQYGASLDRESCDDWGSVILVDRGDGIPSWGVMIGPTPLIAACRAIVAAKLGDEVDVPEELA